MKGFESVSLTWEGETYTVPPEGQLMLIAKIEDALRGDTGESAVEALMKPGGPGTARLCMAYGAALRHAGANVGPDDVYLHIMNALAEKDADPLRVTQAAILSLLAIVAPPVIAALTDALTETDGEKKTEAAE